MLLTLAVLFALTFGTSAGFAIGIWFSRRQTQQLRDAFSTVASQALQASTQHLVQLAQEKLTQQQQASSQELEGKQALINQTLAAIQQDVTGKLEKVTTLVTEIDKNRHASFATLTQQIGQTGEQLKSLQTTTADLRAALANSRTRGQWGERMAEDVLRNAGLKEGVQYRKQSTLHGETTRGRPDYTFMLPGQRVLHMDVKFPLDNYLACLNAENETDAARAAKQFVADARARLKETATREYRAAPTHAGEQALDDMLIFIPNEQVYAFLLEQAPSILDDAQRQHLILCSPGTLLVILAVIANAAQHYQLQQQTGTIKSVLDDIRREWEKFTGEMDKIGKKLTEAQTVFAAVTATRTNAMDRRFAKLDTLALPTGDGTEQNGNPTLLATAQVAEETLQ